MSSNLPLVLWNTSSIFLRSSSVISAGSVSSGFGGSTTLPFLSTILCPNIPVTGVLGSTATSGSITSVRSGLILSSCIGVSTLSASVIFSASSTVVVTSSFLASSAIRSSSAFSSSSRFLKSSSCFCLSTVGSVSRSNITSSGSNPSFGSSGT